MTYIPIITAVYLFNQNDHIFDPSVFKRPGKYMNYEHRKWITVRKDPLNDLGALMFMKNVLKFGLKNSEE